MPNSDRKRREILRWLGASGLAGSTALAGCSGGGNETTTTSGGTQQQSTPTSGSTSTPTPSGDVDESQWPDLSGQSVHLLIDETAKPFRDLFNQLAADFTQATGAQVNNEFAGVGSSSQQRMTQLLQAGDPPELFFTAVGQSTDLIHAGVLSPVDEAINYWQDQYGQVEQSALMPVEGQNFHLPISAKGGVLWYRSDVGGECPSEWDPFLDWCRAVDEGDSGLEGTYVPRNQGQNPDWYHLGLGWSNGARWMERDESGEIQIAIDSGGSRDRWIEYMEYLQQLTEYSPQGTGSGAGGMVESMPAEITASTVYYVVRPKNQSVVRNKSFAADVHGTNPPYNRTKVHTGNSEGFVLFDTENTEAGMEWLKFLSQPKYNVPLYRIAPFQIQPIYPGIRETPEFQEFVNDLPEGWSQEDMEIAQHNDFQIMPNETDPVNPYTGAVHASYNISQMAFDVTIEGMSPADAVDKAAENSRDVLEDAKR